MTPEDAYHLQMSLAAAQDDLFKTQVFRDMAISDRDAQWNHVRRLQTEKAELLDTIKTMFQHLPKKTEDQRLAYGQALDTLMKYK